MSNVQNVDIDRIKSRAKALGISYAFLCAQLGKGKGFFNDVRRGINHIDAYELSIIADKLHTTTDYLIGATDDPSPPAPAPADAVTPEYLATLDPATLRIFELFNSLPEDKRREALDYIEFIIARSKGSEGGEPDA